jgi:hypothetical protein
MVVVCGFTFLVQKSFDWARIKNFSRAVQAKKHKKTRVYLPAQEPA